MIDAPVLIVGGGPVGMMLALTLDALGVRSVIVNAEPTTRWLPKGSTQNARTMEHFRRLGLARPIRALGLPAEGYEADQRLAEISFGEWEGFTIAQLHERDPARIAQREHDKWNFVPPGGESYKHVSERMGRWYGSIERDTVVTAHGGTARGLMAYLGIAKPAAAPLADIAQGVVYVFQDNRMTRYA